MSSQYPLTLISLGQQRQCQYYNAEDVIRRRRQQDRVTCEFEILQRCRQARELYRARPNGI